MNVSVQFTNSLKTEKFCSIRIRDLQKLKIQKHIFEFGLQRNNALVKMQQMNHFEEGFLIPEDEESN